jgi:hypothetical protein
VANIPAKRDSKKAMKARLRLIPELEKERKAIEVGEGERISYQTKYVLAHNTRDSSPWACRKASPIASRASTNPAQQAGFHWTSLDIVSRYS